MIAERFLDGEVLSAALRKAQMHLSEVSHDNTLLQPWWITGKCHESNAGFYSLRMSTSTFFGANDLPDLISGTLTESTWEK